MVVVVVVVVEVEEEWCACAAAAAVVALSWCLVLRAATVAVCPGVCQGGTKIEK